MGTLNLEAFKYQIYSYKVYFNFKDNHDFAGFRANNNKGYTTLLYKDITINLNHNFPLLTFEFREKLTEKQIRKDFHNSQFISKIEGDLRVPVKEALKTFKI